jgi:CRISPR-associated endonuclease/helicase Cas3
MNKTYYGHSLEQKPVSEWQPLEKHLIQVAQQAESFAQLFGAGNWAYNAGLWHDLGKYSEEFQQRLRGGKRVDHATAGAKHAMEILPQAGKFLAYIIAGHHSGLMDGKSNNNSCLAERIKKQAPDYSAFQSFIQQYKELTNLPFIPGKKNIGFQRSFLIRMLFSCVKDADFLDTEKFMKPEKFASRKGYPDLAKLDKKLDRHLKKLVEKAPGKEINRLRSGILKDCIKSSVKPPGLFTLTVPTGGGKTLSSLAFALKHALQHNMKRVIYVIPYVSIIEQNAEVFRKIMGQDAVIEHHSNYNFKNEEKLEEYNLSLLASENWDAPLIVTTNVQFFESLFANKTSKCRKLHNIAKSVVILDEAQMLPVPFLHPCIEALRELSGTYVTSIVLCTATQPALSKREDFKKGLNIDKDRELVSNPKQLYQKLKRVHIKNLSAPSKQGSLDKQLSKVSDQIIAEKITEYSQALCIVNTRNHARQLYEQIKKSGGAFHLSARMCPAHRTQKLAQIRDNLDRKQPCRVISTQLIEAGVDIDFPVVFRAVAGIDSIAQAAGRCNREDSPQKGEVFIFMPEHGLPRGHFRDTAQTAENIIRTYDDILSLEAVNAYFRELYWIKGDELDKKGILTLLEEGKGKGDFCFKEVAEKFRLIENNMESVIIRWNEESDKIIDKLRYSDFMGKYAREAQRFTIQIYKDELNKLISTGVVESIKDQYHILNNMDLYDQDLGLYYDDPTFHKAESMMV